MTKRDDDQLLIAIQSGETAAFEELVDRYRSPLMGFFYRQTRDRQFSEDLTQETLLRIYNQSWDYIPTGRFRGWMYTIARNLLIDNLRRRSNDALIQAVKADSTEFDTPVLARIAADVAGPAERADVQELAELVDGLLAELPEEQRLTFLLHHYAGLPLAEVAEVMESNVATTKSRLRLAREKLQDKLTRRGVGTPPPTTDQSESNSDT